MLLPVLSYDISQEVLKIFVFTTKGRRLNGDGLDVDVGCFRGRHSNYFVDYYELLSETVGLFVQPIDGELMCRYFGICLFVLYDNILIDWCIRLCLVVRFISSSVNVVIDVVIVLVDSALAVMFSVMRGSRFLVQNTFSRLLSPLRMWYVVSRIHTATSSLMVLWTVCSSAFNAMIPDRA